MPKFTIVANPANFSDDGALQIVITSVIQRSTVECGLDELPTKLVTLATNLASPLPDMPLVHVYAMPVGRSPTGYKAFEAAKKNEYTHTPA